jgi:hypothetical protein
MNRQIAENLSSRLRLALYLEIIDGTCDLIDELTDLVVLSFHPIIGGGRLHGGVGVQSKLFMMSIREVNKLFLCIADLREAAIGQSLLTQHGPRHRPEMRSTFDPPLHRKLQLTYARLALPCLLHLLCQPILRKGLTKATVDLEFASRPSLAPTQLHLRPRLPPSATLLKAEQSALFPFSLYHDHHSLNLSILHQAINMADLDIPYLATTISLPESQLQSLLDAPTVELVHVVLQHLSSFAQTYEILKAEKFKSDIELEAAVRSGEARARQLRESVENGLKETESLRRSLNESGRWQFHSISYKSANSHRKCSRTACNGAT